MESRADRYNRARLRVGWNNKVREVWDRVAFVDTGASPVGAVTSGQTVCVQTAVDLAGLNPEDVRVEAVMGPIGATGFLDESIFPMYNRAELDHYIALGELPYVHEKSAIARSFISTHPAWFVQMSARRFVRFWAGSGNSPGSPIYVLHACLTTALGLTGLILLWRRRPHVEAILFAMPLILFPLPYYITHAEFRYRLNLDPILTVLAAVALSALLAKPYLPVLIKAWIPLLAKAE